MAQRKKPRLIRLQDKIEHGRDRDVNPDEKKDDREIDYKERLTQLVAGNDEQYILGFAETKLKVKNLKSKEAVLEYMMVSATSNDTLKYFYQELVEYLDLKTPVPPQAEWKPDDEPENLEEQPWEQDYSEDTDPLDFMRQHFNEAKQRLQNMLDRISICEARLDGHDDAINNIKTGEGGATSAELEALKKEYSNGIMLLHEKMDRFLELEGSPAQGQKTYVVKYPDKPDTKLENVVLPDIWDKLMDLATTRSNVFLAGPTQCGKTKTTELLAQALGLRYSALSCSEGMDEGVFAGTLLPIGDNNKFEYVPSSFVDFYENGGVFLLDEFCAADSNLGVFINNALGNDHFYLARRYNNPLVKKHKDFICIAADNTLGHGGDDMYVGRNTMDASTMERFRTGFLVMNYSASIEKSIADEDVYDWAIVIRRAIKSLQMNRAMTTRTMKEFTKMKLERKWSIQDMEGIYFADWPKDDVNRVKRWIKEDLERALERGAV